MGSITNDIQQTAKMSYGSNDYTINILPDKVQIDSRQGKVVINAEILSTEAQSEWIETAGDYTCVIVKMLKNVRQDIYDRIERDEHAIDGLENKINDYIRKTDPRIETLFTRVAQINDKVVVFMRIVENKFSEIDGRIDALETIIDISGDEIKSLIDQVKEIKQDIVFIKDKSSYLEKRIKAVENKNEEQDKKINSIEKIQTSQGKAINDLKIDQKRQDDDRAKLWKDQARQDANIKAVAAQTNKNSAAITETNKKLNSAVAKIDGHTKTLQNHEERIEALEERPAPGPGPVPPFTKDPAIWFSYKSKDGVIEYGSMTDKWKATEEYFPQRWLIIMQEEEKKMKSYISKVAHYDLLTEQYLWRKVRRNEDFFPKKEYVLSKLNICMRMARLYHKLMTELHIEYKKNHTYWTVSVGDFLVKTWRYAILVVINSYFCDRDKMSEEDLKHWYKEYLKAKEEDKYIRNRLGK